MLHHPKLTHTKVFFRPQAGNARAESVESGNAPLLRSRCRAWPDVTPVGMFGLRPTDLHNIFYRFRLAKGTPCPKELPWAARVARGVLGMLLSLWFFSQNSFSMLFGG